VTYAANGSGVLTPTTVNAFADVMASTSAPIPGINGNARPNSILGNGSNSLSLSLSKAIAFTERIKFSGGIQVANALNRKDYSDPSYSIDSPTTFGVSTGYQGLRTMLLNTRLTF
jgi:hypothetical protein